MRPSVAVSIFTLNSMKKKIPTTRQNQLFTNPEIFDKNFLAKVYKKQNDQAYLTIRSVTLSASEGSFLPNIPVKRSYFHK